MAELSPTQLVIVAVIVVAVVALIVLGLRRGSLKSASFQGMGMRADVKGGQEPAPLADQTLQTDGYKAKRSHLVSVKSAKMSLKRTKLTDSTVQILPDDGSIQPVIPPARGNPGASGGPGTPGGQEDTEPDRTTP
ncbi:hypothetical protein [Streptomyces sp. L2]|uniref:hypothetical protein n=1 Tax=Streptomyces sp. L2 TaxID=2162665 RepID=UPI00101262C3|nr:hypothetical protein [Streptomyces sp. L2]